MFRVIASGVYTVSRSFDGSAPRTVRLRRRNPVAASKQAISVAVCPFAAITLFSNVFSTHESPFLKILCTPADLFQSIVLLRNSTAAPEKFERLTAVL
jgi:hypothetical protein